MPFNHLPADAFLKLGLVQNGWAHRTIDRTCSKTNEKRFKGVYYACPKSVEDIYVAIQSPDLGNKRISRPRPAHLLHALRFLKMYETQEQMAGPAKCTEKTVGTRVWKYIEAIQALKEVKVSRVVEFY